MNGDSPAVRGGQERTTVVRKTQSGEKKTRARWHNCMTPQSGSSSARGLSNSQPNDDTSYSKVFDHRVRNPRRMASINRGCCTFRSIRGTLPVPAPGKIRKTIGERKRQKSKITKTIGTSLQWPAQCSGPIRTPNGERSLTGDCAALCLIFLYLPFASSLPLHACHLNPTFAGFATCCTVAKIHSAPFSYQLF